MSVRRLIVEFAKMHGGGNDFIVIDNRFYAFTDEELSEIARRYCPRRVGIGADGLMALSPPERADTDYRMRFFNADGSLAPMCGNGARCLARFARLAEIGGSRLRFESDAGIFDVEVPDPYEETVRLYLRPPEQFTAEVPVALDICEAVGPVHYIWTGTDHAVVFVKDVETFPVVQWGKRIRHDSAFAPSGTNVNFVQLIDNPGHIRIRTFERGVEGETLACGTGAVASALIAHLLGMDESDAFTVEMPGGTVTVRGVHDSGGIVLEGPAAYVYRGTFEY